MSLCSDLSEFLDTLKQMRITDDKIISTLNTKIPTQSFKLKVDATESCKEFYFKLLEMHEKRNKSLQDCLQITVANVQILRSEKEANPDDINIQKSLKKEQIKLRELSTQVNVEEILKENTLKTYYERCRSYYRPEK